MEIVDNSKRRTIKDEGEIIMYHVFTNGKDEFTRDFEEAKKQFMDWHSEGKKNIRLWEFVYADEEDFEDEIVAYEDCIMSCGDYPA